MTVFSLPEFAAFAGRFRRALGAAAGRCRFERYANGEQYLSGVTAAEHAAIVASVSPPDHRLLETTLLAHTLKKEEAKTVTLVLPYLGYARQDKDKIGESMATAWAGSMYKACGVDHLVVLDVHSDRDRDLIPVEIVSVSAAPLFAQALRRMGWADASLAAPDNGAVVRTEAVAAALGSGALALRFEKKRTSHGIHHTGPVGVPTKRVVLVDDILDTGETLVSAARLLRKAGARELVICVSHGLFTGSAWKRLWRLGVKVIYCTDSVPNIPKDRRIKVLPVAGLLAEAMRSLT